MAIRGGGRSEALITSVALGSRGLESLPLSTVPLDAPALAMEHILASLAGVEARLDANDRRSPNLQQQRRPDPDPPYNDTGGWKEDAANRRLVFTQAV